MSESNCYWTDLSDGELRARLINRGVAPDDADVLVHDRDSNTETIEEVFEEWKS